MPWKGAGPLGSRQREDIGAIVFDGEVRLISGLPRKPETST
jgi:hypothetical protein